MDFKTYYKQQMANVYSLVDDVVKDTTDEQFNWLPPGTVSPISAILLHLFAAEDYFIQHVIQGQSLYWVVQEWGQKIGVQAPPGQGRSWEEFKSIKIPVAPVLAYGQAIRVATDAYLTSLTAEELGRRVNFAGNEITVAEVLMILVVHGASHAGEIAAVKGMQGIQGLPY